ncbi:hypothetical protein AVEN_21047-1 [Araneus ventricosus]|uniref:Uncharacterized protein n=1 Tax=Araneus ventricosus TaxID=182803 RepID=A0A4Y2H1Y3_ARAVE|nr:hypothetical protein AVEN_21047-1 [Araneus ventricosus]
MWIRADEGGALSLQRKSEQVVVHLLNAEGMEVAAAWDQRGRIELVCGFYGAAVHGLPKRMGQKMKCFGVPPCCLHEAVRS